MQYACNTRKLSEKTSISTPTQIAALKTFLQRNSEASSARKLTGKGHGRLPEEVRFQLRCENAGVLWGMFPAFRRMYISMAREERGTMVHAFSKKVSAVWGYFKHNLFVVIFSTR